MAARVTLGKGLTAAGGPSASVHIRLGDPPFIFVMPAKDSNGVTVTGSVSIEQSMDTPPDPNNFGISADHGVSDTNANWQTIVTSLAPGDQQEWRNPLYRIRVNPANVTGGAPNVYMLEGIRSLKNTQKLRSKSRQTQTEKQ